jgi:hypothetical protein
MPAVSGTAVEQQARIAQLWPPGQTPEPDQHGQHGMLLADGQLPYSECCG